MKFLANENFPYPSIIKLRQSGYDVTSIMDISPSISDEKVMQKAIQESRTILTFDRDYGELIFRKGYKPQSGVIYFRIPKYEPDYPAHVLIKFLENNSDFNNYFTVIHQSLIRQRRIE